MEAYSALIIWRIRKSHWIISHRRAVPRTRPSGERIPASQPDPEQAYANQETSQLIDELLRKMKPALRQALTMTYCDELSGPQACAILGVPASTFKTRLARARRQLLNQAQRILVAPIRGTSPSAFFTGKAPFKTIVARRSHRASLDASFS